MGEVRFFNTILPASRGALPILRAQHPSKRGGKSCPRCASLDGLRRCRYWRAEECGPEKGLGLFVPSVSDHPRWNASDDRVVCNIVSTTAPAPMMACAPIRTPGKRLAFIPIAAPKPTDTCLIRRLVVMIGSVGVPGVGRTRHFGARPPTKVIFQNQVPRVQVRLWSDPGMFQDDVYFHLQVVTHAGPTAAIFKEGEAPVSKLTSAPERFRDLRNAAVALRVFDFASEWPITERLDGSGWR